MGAFRFPPADHEVGEVHMEVGDVLVCYTDGIIEAESPQGQEYGTERLKQLVGSVRGRSSREIFDVIARDVDVFSEGARQ